MCIDVNEIPYSIVIAGCMLVMLQDGPCEGLCLFPCSPLDDTFPFSSFILLTLTFSTD